jgi:hypothetical protein
VWRWVSKVRKWLSLCPSFRNVVLHLYSPCLALVCCSEATIMLQSVHRCVESSLLYSRGRSDPSVVILSCSMTFDLGRSLYYPFIPYLGWLRSSLQGLFLFQFLELKKMKTSPWPESTIAHGDIFTFLKFIASDLLEHDFESFLGDPTWISTKVSNEAMDRRLNTRMNTGCDVISLSLLFRAILSDANWRQSKEYSDWLTRSWPCQLLDV